MNKNGKVKNPIWGCVIAIVVHLIKEAAKRVGAKKRHFETTSNKPTGSKLGAFMTTIEGCHSRIECNTRVSLCIRVLTTLLLKVRMSDI